MGLNCEVETAHSYNMLEQELGDIQVDTVHTLEVIRNKEMISGYHIIDFIGGFSYGDHLGSGTVYSNRLKTGLGEELRDFINEGKLIIGICNGFQFLTRYGLLPGFDNDYESQEVALINNDSGKYEDRWVYLDINQDSNCAWTKRMEKVILPARHGEGKLRADDSVLERMEQDNQIVMRYIHPETAEPTMEYPYNPNGASMSIAGICDPTGQVFGMMPHREAALSIYNLPDWTRLKAKDKLPKEGPGVQFSRNGIEYVIENLL